MYFELMGLARIAFFVIANTKLCTHECDTHCSTMWVHMTTPAPPSLLATFQVCPVAKVVYTSCTCIAGSPKLLVALQVVHKHNRTTLHCLYNVYVYVCMIHKDTL